MVMFYVIGTKSIINEAFKAYSRRKLTVWRESLTCYCLVNLIKIYSF